MFAVYIDPLICHTWAGLFILECWGIIPFAVLPVALGCAWLVRHTAPKLAR